MNYSKFKLISDIETNPGPTLMHVDSSKAIAARQLQNTGHRSMFYQYRDYPRHSLGLIRPKRKFSHARDVYDRGHPQVTCLLEIPSLISLVHYFQSIHDNGIF